MIATHQVLKYFPSYLTTLENFIPTKETKGLFWEYMEFYHMEDKFTIAQDILVEWETEKVEVGNREG